MINRLAKQATSKPAVAGGLFGVDKPRFSQGGMDTSKEVLEIASAAGFLPIGLSIV